jgi:hypothetical protein
MLLMREGPVVSARIGFLAAALVLSVGCANGPAIDDDVPKASSDATEAVTPDLPTIDWQNPLGTLATSFHEARSGLAFDPHVPDLGTPEAISILDPDSAGRLERSIAFVYSDAELGEYYVHESLPTMTQDQLEQLATCQPGETGCSTEGWSLKPIRSGITGLVIYAPESVSVATSIMWLEDGIQYTLMGPRSTMTGAHAIAIADQI